MKFGPRFPRIDDFRTRNETNAPLFYDVRNTTLTLYDATSEDISEHRDSPPNQLSDLEQNALCALANLNPNLTTLRLDYCGRLDDAVIASWNASLPNLTSIDLLGPFLVRAPAWQGFFKAHPNLDGFRITQNPRFDADCLEELMVNSPKLTELRLREVGKMCDDFLEVLESVGPALTYLDLAYPGNAELVGEVAVMGLVKKLGPTLKHLDLSGITTITDEFFLHCLKEHAPNLESLTMADLEEVTDEKIGQFFLGWEKNSGLTSVNLSRNHTLSSLALNGVLQHSGPQLKSLNINGWKAASNESLTMIAELATGLSKIDVGWCREVDDFALAKIQDECDDLKVLSCWGCNRVTPAARRRVSTLSDILSLNVHPCLLASPTFVSLGSRWALLPEEWIVPPTASSNHCTCISSLCSGICCTVRLNKHNMKLRNILTSVFGPSLPSGGTSDKIAFQVHNAINRLINRKPSRSFKVRSTVSCPQYRRPFVATLVIAVEGGVQGGGGRADGVFDVWLSRVVLRDLWWGSCRFWLVQGLIRDLYAKPRVSRQMGMMEGETHSQAHDISH